MFTAQKTSEIAKSVATVGLIAQQSLDSGDWSVLKDFSDCVGVAAADFLALPLKDRLAKLGHCGGSLEAIEVALAACSGFVVDGTSEDDSLQGDGQQAPFYILDIDKQTHGEVAYDSRLAAHRAALDYACSIF